MSEQQGIFIEELMAHILHLTKIPKVQVERAIGPILGLFIEELLSTIWGKQVEVICEEFPLLKEQGSNCLSTNIDWLLKVGDDQLIFLELKTAYSTFNEKQEAKYVRAIKEIELSGSSFLLTNLEKIMEQSQEEEKYEEVRKCFLAKLRDSNCKKAKLVYLAPLAMRDAQCKRTGSDAEWLSFADFPKITRKFAAEWEVIRRHLVGIGQQAASERHAGRRRTELQGHLWASKSEGIMRGKGQHDCYRI